MNFREPRLYVHSHSAAGCALLGAAAVVVISLFALNNLAQAPLSVSGVASVLWLGLVALCAGAGLKGCGGLAGLARGALQLFSRVEFVALDRAGCLHHGFVLWGQEFRQVSLPLSSLSSVRWSPGQASSMTGQDMDDWSVAIWFQGEQFGPKGGLDSLWLLGSPQPASDASRIGERLVAFLRRSGCGLRRDSEHGYVLLSSSRPGITQAGSLSPTRAALGPRAQSLGGLGERSIPQKTGYTSRHGDQDPSERDRSPLPGGGPR